MKREDLKKLGLSDEQIEGVMSAHGKDITSLQEKVNRLTSERDGLKSQLDERDQQLVDLQKNSKNVDDLNEKIKQLQADNKKANEEWQNKLATQTKNFKIETALREADEEAFETLVEVMSAKVKEDRPVSPREALRRLRGK
ncbi:MAG: phage scaffolding protein [Lactobacillus sp.]|nr:phage scaffolding protein [Lactobacillus sp.]